MPLERNPPVPAVAIVDGADDARFGQGVVIFHEDQRGGQAHDVTGREVLSCGLVAGFGELANQFLKDEPHFVVADGMRG